MAISFVGFATNGSSSASSFNITRSLTNGNFAVVYIALQDTTKTVLSVSDTGGSTYYFRNVVSNTGVRLEMWSTTHAGITGSPTQLTVTLSGTIQVEGIVGEYSGVVALSCSNPDPTISASTAISMPYTTTGNNSFILTGMACPDNSTYSVNTPNINRGSVVGTLVGVCLADNNGAVAGIGANGIVDGTVTNSVLSVALSLELLTAAVSALSSRLVQAAENVNPSSATMLKKSAVFENPNVAGNLIVVGVYVGNTTDTVTISDSAGNTYQLAIGPITSGGSVFRLSIYYAENIAGGGNTVTATLSVGSIACRLCVHEYSGLSLSASLDQTSSSSGAGSALDSGSQTTTSVNEVIFGFGGIDESTFTFTAGTNFTNRVFPGTRIQSEDRVVTSIASYSASMTASSTANWAMLMATFKDIVPPPAQGSGFIFMQFPHSNKRRVMLTY